MEPNWLRCGCWMWAIRYRFALGAAAPGPANADAAPAAIAAPWRSLKHIHFSPLAINSICKCTTNISRRVPPMTLTSFHRQCLSLSLNRLLPDSFPPEKFLWEGGGVVWCVCVLVCPFSHNSSTPPLVVQFSAWNVKSKLRKIWNWLRLRRMTNTPMDGWMIGKATLEPKSVQKLVNSI